VREEAKNEVCTLAEIEQLESPQFVIDSLLPRPGVAVIGGAPKIGKSVLAFGALVDALARGTVFGEYRANIARAFYFNAEGGTGIMRSRSASWEALSTSQRANVLVSGRILKITDSNGKLDESTVDAIAHYVRRHVDPVDLVCFDPLVYYHAGDENKNDHMQHAMEGFSRVAKRLDCGVLIVHHANKRSGDSMRETRPGGRDLRGADAVFAAADGVIVVTGNMDEAERHLFMDLRHGDSKTIDMRFDKRSMRMTRV
jgi:RecA-family ATPase